MFTTITQAERDVCGVQQLPDSPQITAAALKELFDSLGNLAIDKFITHIDEIEDETAAGSIGVTVPAGYSASPLLQPLLDEIVLKIADNASAKHTHNNKETLDAITEAVKAGYDALTSLLNGIETIQTSLTDSVSGIPTSHAVVGYVATALNNSGFQKRNQVIDDIYPVGSVYQTTLSTFNPSEYFGGSWNLKSTSGGIRTFERTA